MSYLKRKKVSELPEITNTSDYWIFGSKTVNNVATSVKFAFDKITALFGVTQEKGQSLTLAVSQKLFTESILKDGSTNFLNNYRWEKNKEGLAYDAYSDSTIQESTQNNYFDYIGRCVRLYNGASSGTRDWRILTSNIQANQGQRIRVTAEIFLRNGGTTTAARTLKNGVQDSASIQILSNGLNMYNYEFDYTPDITEISLWLPAELGVTPEIEVCIGRVYIGLASYGSIDGDNIIADKLVESSQDYSNEAGRFLYSSKEPIGGEYFNGAVQAKNGYTIPNGNTGSNSYVAQVIPVLVNINGGIKILFQTNLDVSMMDFRLDLASIYDLEVKKIDSSKYIAIFPITKDKYPLEHSPRFTIQFLGSNGNSNAYFFLLDAGYYSNEKATDIKTANQVLIEKTLDESIAKTKIAINDSLDLQLRDSGVYFETLTYGVNPSELSNTFYSGNINGIACNLDLTKKKGVLQTITFRSENEGRAKFGTGFIDQRGIAIISKNFEIDVTAGKSTYKVADLNIILEKETLLFVYILGITDPRPMYAEYTNTHPIQMYYNGSSPDGVLDLLPTQYGGYVDLSYSVSTTDNSIFTPICDTMELDEKVNTVNNNLINLASQQNIFTDNATGIKYKLRVTNANINVIPMIFKHAVCIGNSMTAYGVAPPIWWSAGGMAAYQQSEDYVHILQQGLRVKDNTAIAVGMNAFAWERDFNTDKDALFGAYLIPNTDLIIFRLGENIPNPTLSTLQPAFKELVQYCLSKCPNAEILITGVFWANVNCDTAFRNVADELGFTFVPLYQLDTEEYKEKVGNKVLGDDGLEHEITNGGVANHPSSKGMKAKANLMLQAVGYSPIKE